VIQLAYYDQLEHQAYHKQRRSEHTLDVQKRVAQCLARLHIGDVVVWQGQVGKITRMLAGFVVLDVNGRSLRIRPDRLFG
jgi:hypothetical protein